jgi:hypothetical protein
LELFSERPWGAGIASKDAVPIGIDRGGEPIAADELLEEQEVPVRVFSLTEDPTEHGARGVIDGSEERQLRPALFEPEMVAAIHLDEQPALGHALAAAPMTGRATRPRAPHPGGPENPLDGTP